MNIAEAQVLLADLAPPTSTVHSEIGTRGTPPHDYAYLKLTSLSDPEDYAVVSTPGDGWFELAVTGGFNTGTTSDLTLDEHVREILEEYLQAAIAYLDGHWSARTSRLWRLPFISLKTDQGILKLTLSVQDTVKHVFRTWKPGA